MSTFIFGLYAIFVAAASSQAVPPAYQPEHPQIGVPFVQSKESNEICPPLSPSTLEVVQNYLDGTLPRSMLAPVAKPGEMADTFEVPPLNFRDLELLTDADDVGICQKLNSEFRHLLDLAVDVLQDSGVERKRLYEISYFRAEKQGMYVVAASAPIIVSEDKEAETIMVIQPPGLGTFVRFYDSAGEPIFAQDVQSHIAESEERRTPD